MTKLQALLKANLALAKLIDNEANGIVSIDRDSTVENIKEILDEVFADKQVNNEIDYVLADKIVIAPSIKNELDLNSIYNASHFRKAIIEGKPKLTFMAMREVRAQMTIYETLNSTANGKLDYILADVLMMPPASREALTLANIKTAREFREYGNSKLNTVAFVTISGAMDRYEETLK